MTKVKGSIRNKLMLAILCVLSINIVVVLVFGQTFLESYYIHNKKGELRSLNAAVRLSYQNGSTSVAGASTPEDEFKKILIDCKDELIKCQENNVTYMFAVQSDTGQIILFTPNTAADSAYQNQERIDSRSWWSSALSTGIVDKLEGDPVIIQQQTSELFDSLFLYSKLSDGLYFFMETPRAYIETTAQTAMQFFLILSIGTLILGIIITILIANRIARPIKQIDQTAQKIAGMDFSEQCEVHTGDEIEALANSVNSMSEKLKENISLLRRDLEREEQTNKMRREFIANVSHDLKTPISLISAYGEMLKDNSKDEKTSEICGIVLEQSETMTRLVNQLLTLSQLESGMLTYDMSFFSINDLIRTVVKNCQILLDQNSISFDTQINEEYMVKGDYNRITQVFTNLFENAIKYVDDQRTIAVRLTRRDNWVRTSIFNSHAPLTQQELENVFTIFYKSDKARKASNKSYGIGLAIVKTIIEAHGGSYGAFNSKDGVVFWFELELFDFDQDEEFED